MVTVLRNSGIRPRRVMSFGEEQYLDDKIKYLEAQKGRKEIQQGVSHDPKDIKGLDKRLDELKTIKNRYGAVRLEGKERMQAELEIKRLEDLMAKKWGPGGFPSYAQYWMRPKEGGIQYLNLVDKIYRLNADREYAEYMRRWKYLRRCLEPDDRNIDSTLHLFKK